MATLLVYKRMTGEPLGVLAEDGTSYFGTGTQNDKQLAEASISVKGTAVPWDVFADQLASGFNHTELWGVMSTDQSLPAAYNTVYDQYQASESAQVSSDQ